jgi:hypothetical protein
LRAGPRALLRRSDRFAGDVRGEEGTGFGDQGGAAGELPGGTEDGPALQGVQIGIAIPTAGDRSRPLRRQIRIERGQNVAQGGHAVLPEKAARRIDGVVCSPG